jgi:hypothetical protein
MKRSAVFVLLSLLQLVLMQRDLPFLHEVQFTRVADNNSPQLQTSEQQEQQIEQQQQQQQQNNGNNGNG